MRALAVLLFMSAIGRADMIAFSFEDPYNTKNSSAFTSAIAEPEKNTFPGSKSDIHGLGHFEKLGNINDLTFEELGQLLSGNESVYLTGAVLRSDDLITHTPRGAVVTVSPVPEPSAIVLLATALAITGVASRRHLRT